MANHRITQEEFIRRAKKKHGNKYDYSKTIYDGCDKDIIVICPIHGEFIQKASAHLKHGCMQCSIDARRRGKEGFIEKAVERHGDKFDYSEVVYEHNKKKVKIRCKKCGNYFWQKPNTHLNGSGCPYCSPHRKLNKEIIIERCTKIFGDVIDFSKAKYVNTKTKMELICKKCGKSFWQYPDALFEGHGCNRCARNAVIKMDDFIERAREVHGDAYDYSQVKYKNSDDNITIICPKHGPFVQNVRVHLAGHGCWKCYGERSGEMRRMSQEEFLRRAQEMHGDKYDYSEAVCKGGNEKVKIKCNTCGRYFYQLAGNHVEGQGCPYCIMSKHEKRVKAYLEKHGINYEPHYYEYDEDIPLKYNRFNVDFYIEIESDNGESPKRYIIECNGAQHYRAIGFFGGQKQFEWQQMRDNALREHCKKKGIKYIELPYTEYDRTEEILDKEIP
jgi:ribosomal protein L33